MNNHHHQQAGTAVATDQQKYSTVRLRGIQKLRWDDIVVVFFALLGFVGSVALYRTASAPPIIISFFLATGVASLVYRFLGGIQGATFAWGALKVGGTMAALVGIAIGVNRYLEVQWLVMVSPEGQYEWQWAGEGWKGYVEVKKDGSANIEMLQYRMCGTEQKTLRILEQHGPGKVEEIENLKKLRVNIPVQFVNYDASCNQTGVTETKVLTGDLDRKPAFAGRIKYGSKYGAPLGDMILVQGYSSGVH